MTLAEIHITALQERYGLLLHAASPRDRRHDVEIVFSDDGATQLTVEMAVDQLNTFIRGNPPERIREGLHELRKGRTKSPCAESPCRT